MAEIWFGNFCEEAGCKNVIEWVEVYEIDDHNKHYESSVECIGCSLIGKTDDGNIEQYPTNCIHLAEIKKYELKQTILNTKHRREGIVQRRKDELDKQRQATWDILKYEHV